MHGATTRLVLEFRILGPLEIREGARILPPLAPKQRALLAAMLLRAGQFVSKQRLIDDVWGEDAPATVTNSLENQIWRLRQALGKDVVVTRSPGYVLAVEPEQVAALRLEQLLGRARAVGGEERAATLREALALFAGPPLADLGEEPFARVHAGRLAELELVAREELIAAELDLGRHAELVPELERLVAEHPYRERLREQGGRRRRPGGPAGGARPPHLDRSGCGDATRRRARAGLAGPAHRRLRRPVGTRRPRSPGRSGRFRSPRRGAGAASAADRNRRRRGTRRSDRGAARGRPAGRGRAAAGARGGRRRDSSRARRALARPGPCPGRVGRTRFAPRDRLSRPRSCSRERAAGPPP